MEIATSVLKFYVEMIQLAREAIQYFSRSSGGKMAISEILAGFNWSNALKYRSNLDCSE